MAWVGLFHALARDCSSFDPVEFEAYVRWRTEGAILDAQLESDEATRTFRDFSLRLTSVLRALGERLLRAPEADEIAHELGMSTDDYGESLLQLAARGMARLEVVRPGWARLGTNTLQPEYQSALIDALEALPEQLRQLLELHCGEQLPLRDAGATLGVEEKVAVQLYTEAIHRLRATMGCD